MKQSDKEMKNATTPTAIKDAADNVKGFESINIKDAGNRSRDHYKSSMSKLRFKFRQACLPLIRWETPHLANIQTSLRSKLLDDYFALTANLGTHTFFVIMLPMPFWFGYAELGRALVYVLAIGVYVSGFLKDLLCLPRPLSPPLHRITMSGSAALEYGFPSTHSTNAVSAGLLLLYTAFESADSFSPFTYFVVKVSAFLYIFSITLGRIYCGMHGFSDVIAGSLLGAALFYMRWIWGPLIDSFMISNGIIVPILWTIIILILVRIHPEPVDPCPCFEDSVAFAGVILGMDIGWWMYSRSIYSDSSAFPGSIPYSYEKIGLIRSILRVFLGLVLVFVYRAIMKPFLHEALPPLYRVIERIGLSMPREFFLKASEYKDVPSKIPDTTLVEAREIPSLVKNIARLRSDSVGPQSTADMYETIAYREERKRRHSLASNDVDSESSLSPDEFSGLNEDEMLQQIPKPRVQYDVEVITKLIVYSGIGFIAVGINGIIFELIGLGIGIASTA
ncbi:hypothetical protein V1511DRAFT_32677 [Dipodascopsis uninucleata]